jgi:predicted RND superfamily exporter protein
VQVESNTIEMFSRRMDIRRAYDVVDAGMGGSMSVEILLDTGKPQGIADPDFLHRFAALESYVKAHPMTTTTTSVLDILRKIRRAFHENRPEYYALPESSAEALQYLLLYEMSGGTDKEKLVSFEYDVARLTARTRSLDTKDVRSFLADVQAFADTHIATAATVEQTGMLDWVRAMNDLIGTGQKQSFFAAFLVIAVIIATLLRSVRLGLIAMLPNLFPVIVCLGIMGFFGVYVDIAMMTFSAVILSVGDDDTIHSFARFRREFAACGNYAVAIERTLSTVGRPIVFTTLTLTSGFAVLAASNMTGIRHFGVFAGIAFTWALLADLLLGPAILLVTQPLGPETGPDSRALAQQQNACTSDKRQAP